jgi:hypothetical protein
MGHEAIFELRASEAANCNLTSRCVCQFVNVHVASLWPPKQFSNDWNTLDRALKEGERQRWTVDTRQAHAGFNRR